MRGSLSLIFGYIPQFLLSDLSADVNLVVRSFKFASPLIREYLICIIIYPNEVV